MFTINLHVLLHALEETAKLLPFLFLTYLLMEFIEHKAGERTAGIVAKAGPFGPFFGGLFGVLPQCGFSASASGLYAGGLISMGTLVAVFLSTSDEMLPVMLSEQAEPRRILSILGVKVVCAVLIGFCVDFVFRLMKRSPRKASIGELCKNEHCGCHGGILRSSVIHTLQVALFILVLGILAGGFVEGIGEERLAEFAASAGFLTPLVCGLVGLIPNCASSVILTELFLDDIISTGSLLAGLLAGSGMGLLILFRVNKNWKENLLIAGTVYTVGALVGIAFDLLHIVL